MINTIKAGVGLYLHREGPNLGKPRALLNLVPKMPTSSLYLDSLKIPLVASTVTTPQQLAPTVGQGTSGLRSSARPYTPLVDPVRPYAPLVDSARSYSPPARSIATGRMIATGGLLQIQPSSYRPASTPVTHAIMMPVGSINLFVGFARATDLTESEGSVGRPRSASSPYAFATRDPIYSNTLPIAGGDDIEHDANL